MRIRRHALILAVCIFLCSSLTYSDTTTCILYPPTSFQNEMRVWLKQGLKIQGFDSWLFKPGALYGSPDIWWHTKTSYKRAYPHEGVDFYYYQNQQNQLAHVAEGTPVPLIYDGTLKFYFKDFIGLSVGFATDQYINLNGKKFQFYVLYAHVKPIKALETALDKHYPKSEVLFTYNQQYKKYAPPHLHITTFWADEEFQPKNVSWDVLDTSPHVILINPLLSKS